MEAPADPKGWNTPRKRDQAAYDRSPNGSFAGFEATPPFEYHDVRLPLLCSNHCFKHGLIFMRAGQAPC